MTTIQNVVGSKVDHSEIWGKQAGQHKQLSEQQRREDSVMEDLAVARAEYTEAVRSLAPPAERQALEARYRSLEATLLTEAKAHAPKRQDVATFPAPLKTKKQRMGAGQISQTPTSLQDFIVPDTTYLPDVAIDPLPLSEADLRTLFATVTDGGRSTLTWEEFRPFYHEQDPSGVLPSDSSIASLLKRRKMSPEDVIDYDTFCILQLHLHQRL